MNRLRNLNRTAFVALGLSGLAIAALFLAVPRRTSSSAPGVPAFEPVPLPDLPAAGSSRARVRESTGTAAPSSRVESERSAPVRSATREALGGPRSGPQDERPASGESAIEVARSEIRSVRDRILAIEELIHSADPAAGTLLANLTLDLGEPEIQVAALAALERRQDERARDVATRLLVSSPSAGVRAEAAMSLMADLDENPDSVRLLAGVAEGDPQIDVRIACIEALATAFDRTALERISIHGQTDEERQLAIEILDEMSATDS